MKKNFFTMIGIALIVSLGVDSSYGVTIHNGGGGVTSWKEIPASQSKYGGGDVSCLKKIEALRPELDVSSLSWLCGFCNVSVADRDAAMEKYSDALYVYIHKLEQSLMSLFYFCRSLGCSCPFLTWLTYLSYNFIAFEGEVPFDSGVVGADGVPVTSLLGVFDRRPKKKDYVDGGSAANALNLYASRLVNCLYGLRDYAVGDLKSSVDGVNSSIVDGFNGVVPPYLLVVAGSLPSTSSSSSSSSSSLSGVSSGVSFVSSRPK
jgi:hypothetical protein